MRRLPLVLTCLLALPWVAFADSAPAPAPAPAAAKKPAPGGGNGKVPMTLVPCLPASDELRLASESGALNGRSGPRTANTITATMPMISTLNSGSLAPA